MNDMNELDEQIRKALSNEDAALIGDPNDGLRLDQQVLSVIQSGNTFMNSIVIIFSLVFFGLSVYCVVRFFGTDITKELLTWGFAFGLCTLAMSMLKIWFWMEMQRLAVTREVKRVELLTARLLEELVAK